MELYVGNLPWSVTDQALTAIVAPHAAVGRVKVVTDRGSSRSRGFAFVTTNDEAGGNAAIAALNGKEVEGRALVVRKAEPKPPREAGAGGCRRG